jgi:hypothetical protein
MRDDHRLSARAKPSFDVPEFLPKRDANQMIQRLQAEIAKRTF